MPFYPPHELPPMKGHPPEPGPQDMPPGARRRRMARGALAGALVGAVLAGVAYGLWGGVLAWALIPIAAAFGGWPDADTLSPRAHDGPPTRGPMMW